MHLHTFLWLKNWSKFYSEIILMKHSFKFVSKKLTIKILIRTKSSMIPKLKSTRNIISWVTNTEFIVKNKQIVFVWKRKRERGKMIIWIKWINACNKSWKFILISFLLTRIVYCIMIEARSHFKIRFYYNLKSNYKFASSSNI